MRYLLALVFLAGCQTQQPIALHLLPVVVTYQGATAWPRDAVQWQLDNAAEVYAQAGITLHRRDPYELESEDLYEVDDSNWEALCDVAARLRAERGAVALFYVFSVAHDGRDLRGFATYPPRYGAAIAVQAGRYTTAHELGHLLALKHCWEDDLADTTQKTPYDCTGCNVMSYCDTCVLRTLTPQQRGVVRMWAEWRMAS